jgi:hypothetical protein
MSTVKHLSRPAAGGRATQRAEADRVGKLPLVRVAQQIALEIVEPYPYVAYMKYLLAGSVALAMCVAVMIGGGMLYIDDKARGVHELPSPVWSSCLD